MYDDYLTPQRADRVSLDVASAGAAPIDDPGRIRAVDAIRGFALFGVVWMNLYESTSRMVPHAILDGLRTAPLDRVVAFLSSWLMQGKAQCLFGVLFGFGFAMFTERVTQRRANASLLYARRLAALLLFGTAQFVLLWWGDILHDYAAVGFLLLLTPRLPSAAMPALALGLLFLSDPLATIAAQLLGQQPHDGIVAVHARLNTGLWRALAAGDYGATVRLALVRMRLLYAGPHLLAMWGPLAGQFLLGAFVYRQGWLQDAAAHRRLFRRTTAVALPFGFVLTALAPLRRLLPAWPWAALPAPLWDTVDDGAVLLLAIGYGALVASFVVRKPDNAISTGLAAFGRMALTNYVMQSFFYFFVEYGFGLDLFTRTGATSDLLLGVAVTTAQIAFSLAWLRKYQFGPLEWLWRSVTYGHWQTLGRRPLPAAS